MKKSDRMQIFLHKYDVFIDNMMQQSVGPLDIERYCATPAMQHLKDVDTACAMGLMANSGITFRSTFDHSVNVAKLAFMLSGGDYETAIAGLLHDIASPAGKHVFDFMERDVAMQEQSENMNLEIIKNDQQLMTLLILDGFDVRRISNPKNFPILDCPSPGLCVDRFEYTLANILIYRLGRLSDVTSFLSSVRYDDDCRELVFTDVQVNGFNCATFFAFLADELAYTYITPFHLYSLYMLADGMKHLMTRRYKPLTVDALFKMSDEELINALLRSQKYHGIITEWQSMKPTQRFHKTMRHPKEGVYCVKYLGAKDRSILPLFACGNSIMRVKRTFRKAEKTLAEYDWLYFYPNTSP